MTPKAGGHGADFDRLLERGLSLAGDSPAGPCPPAELVGAWFDRTLPSGEAASVEVHLAGCARCQGILGGLARSEPEMTRVHPALLPRTWTWHIRWLAPTAAAAIVLVVVVSRSDVVKPGLVPAAQETAQVPAAAPPAQAVETAGRDRLALQEQKTAAPTDAVSKRAAPRKDEAEATAGQGASNVVGGVTPPMARAEQPVPAEETLARRTTPAAAAEMAADRIVAEGRRAEPALAAAPARMKSASIASDAGRPETFVAGGIVGWRYIRPGVVSRTGDGGTTWVEQALPDGATLAALSAVSPLVCWAVGRDGLVARSVDGSSWQVVTPPAGGEDLVAVAARNATTAVVRTASGRSYETSDAGATWHPW